MKASIVCGYFALVLVTLLSGCGGGGGGGIQSAISGPPPPPTPTPTPAPTPTPSPTPTPQPGGGTPLTGPNTGPDGAWGPPAVANTLSFPVQSGYDGTGQTIAIIMDAYPSISDLNNFFSYFQIPSTSRSILVEPVDGGPNGSDSADEVTLDVETAASLAPGANIIVYGMPSLTFQGFNDAVSQIISDNVASVANFSAGGCEYSGETSDSVLQEAAQFGIAVVASSGDLGNECFASQVGVNYPASDPNVTGVGGTETDIYGGFGLGSNTVWNDFSCVSGQCAGGGGVSAYFSIPSYQQGVFGSPASNQNRNVPDVSMPGEATELYVGGSWGVVNGTSWSAPQYAALMAELYEYCNVRFQLPPTIPYYDASVNAGTFIDVNQGNDEIGNSFPYYVASLGYDSASGLGVPFGMTLANTVCPNRQPALRRRFPTPTSMNRTAQTMKITPTVRGLVDLGRRPEGQPMRVQFLLAMTPTEAIDERQVVGFLRSEHFRIVRTFRSHLVIDAEAQTGVVDAVFRTEINSELQRPYGVRYMPVTEVTIPPALYNYVSGLSLDDVVTMHSGPVR